MKVIFKDPKTGEIKLIPENLDDIWHLYNIIEEGDLVRAITFRTAEGEKADKLRAKKAEKKKMKLGICVEKVTFHEFSNRLRIQGVIREGPQDLGSYHTFNVDAEEMQPLSILKQQWKAHQLQRIDEAVQQRTQPMLVFVSLDDDAATVALLYQSGVQCLAEIDAHRSGKMYESKETTPEYYGEIFSVLKTVKKPDSPLVIIGPGFTREHLMKAGKEKEPQLFKDSITHATANAGMNGVHEALKVGIVEQITKENRVSKETQAVEKVFEKIKKDELVTYGTREVEEALSRGAADHLFISDVLIRTKNGEHLLDLARKTHCAFMIINTMHDAGKKFDGIGGVAALLRFKY
ncbi:MAG: mRNA surveillance protein pelota [Candidatus Thermoplasmatota archaeon]|nr:mRNA surveillance protein pelota [Candidatus Thermoplasmatota archaeon]